MSLIPRLLTAPFCRRALALGWVGFSLAGGVQAANDLTEVPLEQLVAREVISASRLAQQVSDAPSAVAIITADDIRDFGYRTLADAMNAMRGLYTTDDYRYAYLGGRGFGRPGDYVGRLMLMIDGYASQDAFYNQAFIDNAGFVDMALIDRIEYVPGTGSVTHGNNAMLGIINVVTKKGLDFGTTQVAADWFSQGGTKQRVTFGQRLENGADVLLSASQLDSNGRASIYFPMYDAAATHFGVANQLDGEQAKRFFGKLSYQGLTLEGGLVSRRKMAPYPPNSSARFNAPYWVDDENTFVNARYETDLSLNLKSLTHFYHGTYADQAFREFTVLNSNGALYRANDNSARWVGLSQRFVAQLAAGHVVVFGGEARRDYHLSALQNFIAPGGAVVARARFNSARTLGSLFVTDEYALNAYWKLNAGVRLDKAWEAEDIQRKHLSPRAALMYQHSAQTTLKAAYSEAFRLPSLEDKWSYDTVARSEHVRATELVAQHTLGPETRFTGSLYRYLLSDLTYADPTSGNWVNTGASHTRGVELEAEHGLPRGARLRGSVAWQRAVDVDGQRLINSPDKLGKLGISTPLPGMPWRLGWESQYLGARYTEGNRRLGGSTLSHLTLSMPKPVHGVALSLSVRNLFDRHQEVVAPFVRTGTNGQTQDSLFLAGRTWWLQVRYDF